MLIFESGCVVEVAGSPRKRARMLIFQGRGGDGVGKEQLPLKTRLVFEDKEFNMMRRLLPLLAMSEMVSGATRRDGTPPCCVVMPPNIV